MDHWRRVGLDGRAQRPGGVVQSRAGRPGRDAEGLGDLDQGQPQVVVEDEYRALLDVQALECPVECVAIGDAETISSGPAGPSTGRARTFAAHVVRRLASA